MSDRNHTESTGNVYRDLGFADANARLAKAELPRSIAQLIEQEGLTQREAADVLGIDQPKVSALVRGQLTGFSMDRLLRFALALGFDIDLTLHKRHSRGAGGPCTSHELPGLVPAHSRAPASR